MKLPFYNTQLFHKMKFFYLIALVICRKNMGNFI